MKGRHNSMQGMISIQSLAPQDPEESLLTEEQLRIHGHTKEKHPKAPPPLALLCPPRTKIQLPTGYLKKGSGR